MKANSSVGGRVDGGHLDAADTLSLNSSDLDVTLVTPDGVPRVLDEPVVKTGSLIGAVTDDKDAVIKVGAAGSGVEDTAGVGLEDTFVGLDGDGDWLLSDGGHQLRDAVRCDISLSGDSYIGVHAGAVLAGLLGGVGARGVGVGRLELSVVSLVVDHGTIHGSTIASVGAVCATIGAVDKLLL